MKENTILNYWEQEHPDGGIKNIELTIDNIQYAIDYIINTASLADEPTKTLNVLARLQDVKTELSAFR